MAPSSSRAAQVMGGRRSYRRGPRTAGQIPRLFTSPPVAQLSARRHGLVTWERRVYIRILKDHAHRRPDGSQPAASYAESCPGREPHPLGAGCIDMSMSVDLPARWPTGRLFPLLQTDAHILQGCCSVSVGIAQVSCFKNHRHSSLFLEKPGCLG